MGAACGGCFEFIGSGGHKKDTCASLHPYFKINYGKIPEFKENNQVFYSKTKTESKMLYYGFGFQVGEGFIQHEVCSCREGYSDADGLLAHLANIGETFGKALSMSDLSRIEVHGTPEAVATLKRDKVLQDCKTVFYTLDGKGLRKTSGPYEKCVSLCPYFKIHPGKEDKWKDNAEEFYRLTKTEPAMLNYGFSYTEDNRALCRESYVDGQGLIDHLANIGETFGKALQMSELERLECFAPASELPALKAHPVLQKCGCVFFELDGAGIKG